MLGRQREKKTNNHTLISHCILLRIDEKISSNDDFKNNINDAIIVTLLAVTSIETYSDCTECDTDQRTND